MKTECILDCPSLDVTHGLPDMYNVYVFLTMIGVVLHVLDILFMESYCLYSCGPCFIDSVLCFGDLF